MTRSVCTCLLLLLVVHSPEARGARGWASFDGSHCHASNFLGETPHWTYQGGTFRNRGTSDWDVLVASCPIHAVPLVPSSNSRLEWFYVVVRGPQIERGWCDINMSGYNYPMDVRRASDDTRIYSWSPGPTVRSGPEPWDVTIECLLLRDWYVQQVQAHWFY
jgi:hypothetical protein